jgi:arylsulfatase/arylsulfatase A
MDVYTDGTMRFIRQTEANDQPFFAYLATNTPHAPFDDVPQKLYEHYKNEKADQLAELVDGNPSQGRIDKLARIAAMITNIDQNVGRLMDQLEKLGVAENTLVIYLNDNGPNGRRYVGPFRGRKGQVLEGGIRSPLWLHWPAELDSEMASHRPAAHIDVMPTILDACNVEVPSGTELDGRSVLPLLRQDNPQWSRRSLVIQAHRGNKPTRYHNFMLRRGPWKLVHPSGFGRPDFNGEPAFELYNVVDDPDESEDLIDKRPELVSRLKRDYRQWFESVSNTRPNNYAPPRIVVGTVHENPSVLTRQDWRDGGWGKNAEPGHWLLRVDEAASYDVRVLFKRPPEADQQLTLEVGQQQRTRQVAAGVEAVLFRGVSLQAGPAKLEATLEGEGRGAYQVVVDRR